MTILIELEKLYEKLVHIKDHNYKKKILMYKKRYNKLNILELYVTDYKSKFYLREISKLAKIPLKTTQNLIAKLEDQSQGKE